MKKTKFIFSFLFFFYSFCLLAQAPTISFKRISSNKGLSQSFVHCLMKDNFGFVWAGTQDGLNRFDGYHFSTYYNEKSNPQSLSNNYIWDLFQDQKDNIWIGTNGGGLCLYEPSLDRFSTFQIKLNNSNTNTPNSIRAIFETQFNNILLGSNVGLFLFDTKGKKFEKIEWKNQKESFTKSVFCFERLSENLILLGSIEELLIFDEANKSLKRAKLDHKIKGGIHSLVHSSNGKLWAGTGKGLFQIKYLPASDSIIISQQFFAEGLAQKSISSTYISSLLPDKDGGLWIGTNNGLNFFDTENQASGFYHFKNDPNDETSISNNLVFDLLEVEPGIIWAATQDGINQFSVKPSAFKKLHLKNNNSFTSGSSAHGMTQDSLGDLWLCTEKGLLQINFSERTNQSEITNCLDQSIGLEIEDEFLVSISQGQVKNFWVAMRRGGFGLLKISENNFDWRTFKLPAGDYSNIGTNDFIEEKNGTLWIASSGLGLWKLDQKNEKYSSFVKSKKDSLSISGNYIFALMEDSKGLLWVATADGGLCQMNRKTETFNCYTHDEKNSQSISSNMVLSIFEDKQKRIWACTADGLNLLLEDGSFIRFFNKDGLPNNVIYGMLEDEQNKLWVSTDKGIARINFENGIFTSKNYSEKDGLIKNEFNQHAFYKLKNGQLVFGNKGGLNFFDPADITNYSIPPKIVFTDFKLFNESVKVSSEKKGNTFSLNQHINTVEEIVLPYNKNFLAFEFSGINFEQGSANHYAYQMQGLDKDWVFCGDRKYVTYSGIEPGEYIFRVKAANHDGHWNENYKQIKLIIKNPPWKTWWAYTLYTILAFSIIYGFFNYQLYTIRQIEKTKQEERLLFRKRSAQDFHDEAGNQITKISLMTEIAKRLTTENQNLNDLLIQIEENVQSLRSGMRDFIWVLDPENDNLYETLLRLKEFANGIFEYSSIHFTTNEFDENLKSISLSGNQRRHLLMIFKEAINNCLKYSEAKNAKFVVTKKEQKLELKFSDDGIGFNSENQNKGQGLKNIKSRVDKMKVKHFISSEKNKGTTISIFLNTTQMGN